MKRTYRFSLLVTAIVLPCLCGLTFGAPYILLGPSDNIAIDQPRVTVEVYTPNPPHSFGPDYFNLFLLDTAAQGLIAVGYAVTEMDANGYETVALFDELGVGGATTYEVSEVYNLDFAGSSGTRQTLPGVRILSNEEMNFGSFGGIVGMPGMLYRVSTMDMTAMLGGPFGFDYMGVGFSTAVPAGNGHRYSVPVSLVDFPPAGQHNPNDPLPTYAPLPFVNVELRDGGHSQGGLFVLDTGAQLSILSSEVAFDLGLDKNGDGSLDDDAIDFIPLSGAGGPFLAPILPVDRIVLLTNEGVELIWTDLAIPVIDIHPDIAGVFGCDLLTSGWLEGVFVTGEYGYIEKVHFDFTAGPNAPAAMFLDLNGEYDNVVPDPTGASVVGRWIFYNRSAWDGDDPNANGADDAAIAPDKQALLPGQTGSFANYTSYSRGINGIMVDIANLPGPLTVDDFEFRAGNSDDFGTWGVAPAPQSITVRSGAGLDGSDRVTIVWDDAAIIKQWVQITVLANPNTGLAGRDVFYFGNAVGDCGNNPSNTWVNASDRLMVRANPHNVFDPAPIDDVCDFNRDKSVNAADRLIARANPTNFLTGLKLINVPE